MAVSKGYIDRIAQIESSGDPNAKNPRSSATGLFQFIDSTWMDMVERHEPELMEGRSREEVLDLRRDPEVSTRMFRHFTADNQSILERSGVESTPGRLYLAHFLGAGGARKALSANPDAPVADVLGQNVVEANPFLTGKSVNYLEQWADRKVGDVTVADAAPELTPADPPEPAGAGSTASPRP